MPSNAVSTYEVKLPKVIDARAHGVIDYSHAAFFLGMAFVCRKSNPRAALAALFTGTFVVVQSLLTDYPLGVKPLISFKLHGQIDAAFAVSSLVIPELFGFSETPTAAIFRGNTVVEGTVVALTDWDNTRAKLEAVGP